MKDYGKALKTLRKNANMTQAVLAERLNVTYQTVSKWENGVNTPDISVIEDICALFGVSVEEYLRLAENDSDSSPAPEAEEIAATPTEYAEQALPPRTAAENTQAAASAATQKKQHIDMPYIIVAIVLGAIIALAAIILPIILVKNSDSGSAGNGGSDAYWYVNARAAMFTVEVDKGGSSSDGVGFFVNKNGNAVVGYSVIDGIKSATVTTANGNWYFIDRILGIDSAHDTALVHVDMNVNSTPITFCKTSELSSSDKLYAIDKNNIIDYGETLKYCTKNSLHNVEDGVDYIKTVGFIGKSSILINRRGELVGFNTYWRKDSNTFVRADNLSGLESNVDMSVGAFSQNAPKKATVKFMIGEDVLYELALLGCEKVPQLEFASDNAEFLGWYADKDFNRPFDFSQKCGAGVKYVYAKTKQANCKVMFDGGDGAVSGVMSPVLTGVDCAFTLPSGEFTRKGYKFAGWSYGGKTYAVGEQLLVPDLASIRIQAVWTPIEYMVQYKYGDDVREAAFTYDANNKLSDKLYEREGYKQVGWTIGNTSYALLGSAGNLSATDGAVLVATPRWAPIKYKMCIDLNCDNWQDVIGIDYDSYGMAYIDCEYGADPLALVYLTLNDFEFDGWEVYGTDGEQYTGDLRYVCAEENAVIYVKANWRSGEYYLIVCKHGSANLFGDTLWVDDVMMYSVKLKGKQEYTLPDSQSLIKQYSVDVYWSEEFKEWVIQQPEYSENKIAFEDGATVSDLMMCGAYYDHVWGFNLPCIVLYMRIDYIRYTIEFDGNGGSGSMDDLTLIYGETRALPRNKFKKEGYIFAGWDCGEQCFADGAAVKNLADESNINVTLTARWIKLFDGEGTEQNPYIVSDYAELSILSHCVEYAAGMDSAHYKLAADIDCEGRPLSAIGFGKPFAGVLDGDGHVIKNAVFAATTVTNTDYPTLIGCMGLFAKVIGGGITRLGIEDYTINSEMSDNCYYYAPFAAYYQSTAPLESCYAKGTITLDNVQDGYVSGFVSRAYKSSFSNCFAVVSISHTFDVYIDRSYSTTVKIAGFLAYADSATVENCYADADICVDIDDDSSTLLFHIGVQTSLFCADDETSHFTNCFVVGRIHGKKYARGNVKYFRFIGIFAGVNYYSEFKNIYACAEIAFDDNPSNVDAGGAAAEITSRENLESLDWLVENMDFDADVWVECESGLPELKVFEV